MNISLVWWNSALSPSVRLRDRSSSEEKGVAAWLLNILSNELRIDFIALCEVSPSDIDYFLSECQLGAYKLHKATHKAGRGVFDMCVLYRPDKLALNDVISITSTKGKSTKRIAQHLIFNIAGEIDPVHVFLSHWPSRLNLQQHEPERAILGARLRTAIEGVQAMELDPKIILVGDYNDEPFDNSIAEQLMASRDRNLVIRKKHLFYNPFWRHMASPHEGITAESSHDRGSYFHKNGEITQWRTFDQMMFSSSLVSGGGWAVSEENTRVLAVPGYADLVSSGKLIFDHLPIIGYIQKGLA